MTVYCSQCGVAVTDESQFCFRCGGAIYKGIPPSSSPVQVSVQSNEPTQEVSEPCQPITIPEVTAAPLNVPVVNKDDPIVAVLKSKIGMSKWWNIFATFAFFLCAAIIQNRSQYSTSPLSERIFLVAAVTLIYTAIGAIYFWRSMKITPLMPWEVESRFIKASWYLFVAVTLSAILSAFYAVTNTANAGVTNAFTVAFCFLYVAAGWAAWRGKVWAIVAVFIWVFGGVTLLGTLDPLGLFVIVFSVQAYRYHHAGKQFNSMNLPDLLGTLSGLTKLSYAAAQENSYYVKYLVRGGTDVNELTATGLTPLMLAAATNKRTEVVKYLLKVGADKAAQTSAGRTALDFAKERGATRLVPILS